MPATRHTEDEFIDIWNKLRSSAAVAKFTGKSIRHTQQRRRDIERRRGIVLAATDSRSPDVALEGSLPRQGIRALADIRGTVMVASDCHWWPGDPSVANKAFVRLCKELQPSMVILNGDLMDGARICRQDPVGWDKSSAPTLKEEIEAVQERSHEIALAAGKRCIRIRTIGNHCIRLERYLAMNASEVEGLPGTTLGYYLPEWEATWSVLLNDSTMVKHRHRAGVHATWNNTLHSGKNIVTGHLHRLQATIFSDYNGPRWGIDTGSLADVSIDNPAFNYDEDGPRNWASGFAVLTFDKTGRLLHPEFCVVLDGVAYFRGKPV